MQITYIGSKEDYINAQRTHTWRKFNGDWAWVQKFILPVVGIFFLCLAFLMHRRHDNKFATVLEFICGLYFVFAYSLSTYLYSRAYRRRFSGDRHETTLTISDEAIDCICPGRSSGTLQWTVVTGIVESPTSILLYTSPAMFLNIPKRLLSEDQVKELMGMLDGKGIPKRAPK